MTALPRAVEANSS